MWGLFYSILECGTFIDCHYRNLTKPREPTSILCKHFIAEKVKLPNYCIETPEEILDVIDPIS